MGPNQPTIQWVAGLFVGVKRPGRGVDQPPPSGAEVKETVQLYIYSPSGPSWPVLGWNLLYGLKDKGIITVKSAGARDFYCSQKRADTLWRPNQPLFSGYLELYSGVKGESVWSSPLTYIYCRDKNKYLYNLSPSHGFVESTGLNFRLLTQELIKGKRADTCEVPVSRLDMLKLSTFSQFFYVSISNQKEKQSIS